MPRLAKPTTDQLLVSEAGGMFANSLRASNKSPKTVTTYLYGLSQLVKYEGDIAVGDYTRGHHEHLIAELQHAGWKPSSVSAVYRSLRAFWKWAVAHDDVPIVRDPMNGMSPPIVPVDPPDYPSVADVQKMLKTCESRSRHNYMGHRDAAILRIFATTGARLAEVANLRVEDVDIDAAYPTLRVLGKGRRYRDLPLDPATSEALRRYMRRERPRHPSSGLPWLWLARAGRMTASGIGQMVVTRGEKVGIKVHPHSFRHFAIDGMLRSGMSEGSTMAITGHRSRSMMDRYAASRRAERADRDFREAPRPTL